MLSLPALCFVALVGFLVLYAAFVLFLDRKERERDSPPILDSTDHPIKTTRHRWSAHPPL
jgi:hypothetical protein